MEMSDNWLVCPECGEEVELVQTQIVNLKEFGKDKYEARYYCANCRKTISMDSARKVTTEYLKGEEDEQGNQSRRSKK